MMRAWSRSTVLLSSTRALGRRTRAWSGRPLVTKALDRPWDRDSTTTKIATTTAMARAVDRVAALRCQRERQL